MPDAKLVHTYVCRLSVGCAIDQIICCMHACVTPLSWSLVVLSGRFRRLSGASKEVDCVVWCGPERWRMTRTERGSTKNVAQLERLFSSFYFHALRVRSCRPCNSRAVQAQYARYTAWRMLRAAAIRTHHE